MIEIEIGEKEDERDRARVWGERERERSSKRTVCREDWMLLRLNRS